MCGFVYCLLRSQRLLGLQSHWLFQTELNLDLLQLFQEPLRVRMCQRGAYCAVFSLIGVLPCKVPKLCRHHYLDTTGRFLIDHKSKNP